MRRRAWSAALMLAATPAVAAGQGLADAVAAQPDGSVRFRYEARADVEICDQGIRIGDDRHVMWRDGRWGDPARNCRYGPLEVVLEVRDGRVRDVDLVTSRRDRADAAPDLGRVEADEAAAFLGELALGAGSDRAAREAVLPLALADVDDVWRPLLAVARDRRAPEGARKNALFWVGQEAADAATEGLTEVARDDDERQEVRDAAVFALSQRPADESVPVLMELARDAEQARTRETAMFWLAQSNDERVVRFFEEILLGRGGAQG